MLYPDKPYRAIIYISTSDPLIFDRIVNPAQDNDRIDAVTAVLVGEDTGRHEISITGYFGERHNRDQRNYNPENKTKSKPQK
jgi:hypothetical protein